MVYRKWLCYSPVNGIWNVGAPGGKYIWKMGDAFVETRKYTRIRLEGTDLLNRLGVIYSQIVNDLLMKVDDGNGNYPRGFLHTSTTPLSTPNYYDQMWSRDVGRGIQELVECGLIEDARSVAECVLGYDKSFGNHFGRVVNQDFGCYEVDGNVSLLMGVYRVWKYSGKTWGMGIRYLERCAEVFGWFEELAEESPYGGLLKSKSELSGNPDTDYFIFALFGTYGAMIAALAFREMADDCDDQERSLWLTGLADRFKESLLQWLLSRGSKGDQKTKTPTGVWLNGIDERTGLAAETGDFGPEFDISKWTRQLPFILDYDWADGLWDEIRLAEVNRSSYEYIKREMCKGYFFRKYGFVSNTCFVGMGGRHDDTMAGYGQNYFTQAALLQGDVNVYTKCLDGIARLAYDGDIVEPLTLDLNPWVMHECFTYENYETGFDHTFGKNGVPEKCIMHNPGDEGNLVQSAETVKTMSLVAGIFVKGNVLHVEPRLPWECTRAWVKDYPVVKDDGSVHRISYVFCLDRWKNSYRLQVSGAADFEAVVFRIGPLPNVLCNERELSGEWRIDRKYSACFASKRVKHSGNDRLEVTLVNEIK